MVKKMVAMIIFCVIIVVIGCKIVKDNTPVTPYQNITYNTDI